MARVTVTSHTADLIRTIRNNVSGSMVTIRVHRNQWESFIRRDDKKSSQVVDGFRSPLPYWARKTDQYEPAIVTLQGEFSGSGESINEFSLSGLYAEGGSLAIPTTLQTLLSSGDESRLIVQLLNNIGNQKWALGETLVEAQKSIDMIARSASVLQKALLHAARKNWNGVARSLGVTPRTLSKENARSAGKGWLAYSFGWTPVVQDIAKSALYLGGAFDEDVLHTIMARGYIGDSKVFKRTLKNHFGMPFGGGTISVSLTEQEERKDEFRASLYYRVAGNGNLRELARYGLVGVSTPWAVVPASYLIDWVLPIGDILGAIDATVGLSFLGGSNTRFKRTTVTRKVTDLVMSGSDPATNKVKGSVDWTPAELFDMNRSVYTSSPLPFPAYVKNPLDPWKAVTSVALLSQLKSILK